MMIMMIALSRAETTTIHPYINPLNILSSSLSFRGPKMESVLCNLSTRLKLKQNIALLITSYPTRLGLSSMMSHFFKPISDMYSIYPLEV